jgi:hypothetical protein
LPSQNCKHIKITVWFIQCKAITQHSKTCMAFLSELFKLHNTIHSMLCSVKCLNCTWLFIQSIHYALWHNLGVLTVTRNACLIHPWPCTLFPKISPSVYQVRSLQTNCKSVIQSQQTLLVGSHVEYFFWVRL